MLVGLRAQGHRDVAVHGICVRRGQEEQMGRVTRVVRKTEVLLNCVGIVEESDVLVTDDFLGPAYGRLTESGNAAMLLAARTEALLLDPVYTGKAFAGFLDLVRGDTVGPEPVVFLHTGGAPALFAYGPEIIEATKSSSRP
jgi:1-aminocyclopropane-1-carboxylate deaminase/D-cysteine desulfhydrase-like pyridoxal-dependent ACC family enzyme